jgi:Trypsin-like peptidase domain
VPSAAAIPLACCSSQGTWNIGTGFLARLNGTVGLVTAAHIPTGSQPKSSWQFWPKEMSFFLSDDNYIVTKLFFRFASANSPLFRFVCAEHQKIADMMLLTEYQHADQIKQLTGSFSVIDFVEKQILPKPHEALTCYGFPDVKKQWPYASPIKSRGAFCSVEDGPMFTATVPTQNGMSGGPVFDDSDRFVGMMIGNTDGFARIIPMCALALLWHASSTPMLERMNLQ